MTAAMPLQDRPELRLETYPHHYSIETRMSDCIDARGHITNGVIAMFGDDARLGMHLQIMDIREPRGLQLVETRFQFFTELTFPGPITIGVGVVYIGNSSLRQVAGYFRNGHCHVLAHFALVKASEGKSVPLSASEKENAARFLMPALA